MVMKRLVRSSGQCISIPHHTHTRLTALCPGLPGWAGTRKVKPIWILLEQETVSGSGISWAICKSAPRSRQITTPAPTTQFFTGRMPFLPPNQQRQSTEGQFHSTSVSVKSFSHGLPITGRVPVTWPTPTDVIVHRFSSVAWHYWVLARSAIEPTSCMCHKCIGCTFFIYLL